MTPVNAFLVRLELELNRVLGATSTIVLVPGKCQIDVDVRGFVAGLVVVFQSTARKIPAPFVVIMATIRALATTFESTPVWANDDHSEFFVGNGVPVKVVQVAKARGLIYVGGPQHAVIASGNGHVEISPSYRLREIHDEAVEYRQGRGVAVLKPA